jgi:hypothetical protein
MKTIVKPRQAHMSYENERLEYLKPEPQKVQTRFLCSGRVQICVTEPGVSLPPARVSPALALDRGQGQDSLIGLVL